MAGPCEHVNESLLSKKCKGFLDQLRNYLRVKKKFASRNYLITYNFVESVFHITS